MDLAAAFAVFAGSMIFMMMGGASALGIGGSGMLPGMVTGFAAFLCVGLHRGFPLRDLLRMSVIGAKSSMIVVRVMLTIGVLTGLWRCAGTFAFMTVTGLQLISPDMFILAAFLLTSLLSYAIGTSFGTASTIGVALMTLARSGGVNELAAAGAVMSGIYFGDRGSPASSCANLVAAVTGTDLADNIKMMMRTAALPFALSAAFYAYISLKNPMLGAESAVLRSISLDFRVNLWTAVPAVLMLAMPLLGFSIFRTFIASIISAFLCAVFVQRMSVPAVLHCAVFGLNAPANTIRAIFNGGGLMSMAELALMLFISGTYSGIFDGTGILDDVRSRIASIMRRIGALTVETAAGVLCSGIFCNQAIGVIMTTQLVADAYDGEGRSRRELVQDIANTTVLSAGMIPWCVACSVPLTMFGSNYGAMPYAVYMYLVPICWALTKRFFFRRQPPDTADGVKI